MPAKNPPAVIPNRQGARVAARAQELAEMGGQEAPPAQNIVHVRQRRRGGRLGRASEIIKIRATKNFFERVQFLADVVDGRAGYYRRGKGPKGEFEEYVEATTADKLKALELLARYSGYEAEIKKTDHERKIDEATAAKVIAGALLDPAVRRMLREQHPQAMQELLAQGDANEGV